MDAVEGGDVFGADATVVGAELGAGFASGLASCFGAAGVAGAGRGTGSWIGFVPAEEAKTRSPRPESVGSVGPAGAVVGALVGAGVAAGVTDFAAAVVRASLVGAACAVSERAVAARSAGGHA